MPRVVLELKMILEDLKVRLRLNLLYFYTKMIVRALEYIKSILGMGNVTERGKFASLSITKRTEVKVLIDIFSKFPLNTTKRFDFEDWKLAFEN
jgi:hypothetical protein